MDERSVSVIRQELASLRNRIQQLESKNEDLEAKNLRLNERVRTLEENTKPLRNLPAWASPKRQVQRAQGSDLSDEECENLIKASHLWATACGFKTALPNLDNVWKDPLDQLYIELALFKENDVVCTTIQPEGCSTFLSLSRYVRNNDEFCFGWQTHTEQSDTPDLQKQVCLIRNKSEQRPIRSWDPEPGKSIAEYCRWVFQQTNLELNLQKVTIDGYAKPSQDTEYIVNSLPVGSILSKTSILQSPNALFQLGIHEGKSALVLKRSGIVKHQLLPLSSSNLKHPLQVKFDSDHGLCFVGKDDSRVLLSNDFSTKTKPRNQSVVLCLNNLGQLSISNETGPDTVYWS